MQIPQRTWSKKCCGVNQNILVHSIMNQFLTRELHFFIQICCLHRLNDTVVTATSWINMRQYQDILIGVSSWASNCFRYWSVSRKQQCLAEKWSFLIIYVDKEIQKPKTKPWIHLWKNCPTNYLEDFHFAGRIYSYLPDKVFYSSFSLQRFFFASSSVNCFISLQWSVRSTHGAVK